MADYIVPAVLKHMGVLRYSPSLDDKIKANEEIGPGSEEEVELRACSIHAVEKMRELIALESGKKVRLVRACSLIFLFLFFLTPIMCVFSGTQCGARSLALVLWDSVFVSESPPNAFHILLSAPPQGSCI